MNTKDHKTRPTPDSDAIRDRVIAGNCDIDDLLDALERFERERDEALDLARRLLDAISTHLNPMMSRQLAHAYMLDSAAKAKEVLGES